MAFTENQQIVVDLFIAAYGRAPAQGGLDFFTGKLDSGEWTEDDIANYMMDTRNNPEAATRFPEDVPTADKVEAVFNNVLGRGTSTQEGLDFWVNKVDNEPDYTMADLMKDVLNAAKEADGDKDTLANKAAVAEHFLAVVPVDQQVGNQPDLSSVTSDPATVEAADAAIDALVNPAIKLTTGPDSISAELTDGNDIIVADAGTLGSDDIIMDPSTKDNDVLNATVNADDLAPRIMNIETINLTGEYAKVGLDLNNVIGAKTINTTASIVGTKAVFTNASSVAVEKIVAGENILTIDVSAAAGGTTDAITIEAGDASNIKLDGNAKEDTFTVDLVGGNKNLTIGTTGAIETLTINSNSAENTLTLGDATSLVDATKGKVVLAGDQNITIKGDSDAISGSAKDKGIVVEDTGAGVSKFVITDTTTAANKFVNKAAFDFITLSADADLTVNENTTLTLNAEITDKTFDVDNVDGNMDAGAGTLHLDIDKNVTTKLTAGVNVGTLDIVADTADIKIKELDTKTTATKDTTVALSGNKNVEITKWTNLADEVLSAKDFEANLTLGFVTSAASALSATVIAGKGDDTITLGDLKTTGTDEYLILTNDGKDKVIGDKLVAGDKATILTGAGDDEISMALASSSAFANIKIDGGSGTDKFTFSKSITINADDQISNIEDFVAGADGKNLTLKNMDTLSSIKSFSGDGSATTIEELQIVGTDGDDTIDVSGITFKNGSTHTIQGGGGNDTVSFTTDDLKGEKFIFEASAGANGVDTINNFVAGATNADKLDFSAYLGNNASATAGNILKVDADNAYSANPSAQVKLNATGQVALLVDIKDGQDITTADGLLKAISSGGEYANFDFTAAATAVIITSKSDATDDAHLFYVTATGTADTDITVEEVGIVKDVDIDNFTFDNFYI